MISRVKKSWNEIECKGVKLATQYRSSVEAKEETPDCNIVFVVSNCREGK